jgi:hypothetical protein
MDFTMLCQICRCGRLAGIAKDYIHSNTLFREALKILFPESDAVANSVEPLAPVRYGNMETARHNSKGVMLAPNIYDEILTLVNLESPHQFSDITVTFPIL